ncbi:hypothetical protein [Streptomyces sp. O3]
MSQVITQGNETRQGDAIQTDGHEHPPSAAEPLHRLLTSVLNRLDEAAAESVLHAVTAELDARDARAYASGWQDAVRAMSDG